MQGSDYFVIQAVSVQIYQNMMSLNNQKTLRFHASVSNKKIAYFWLQSQLQNGKLVWQNSQILLFKFTSSM